MVNFELMFIGRIYSFICSLFAPTPAQREAGELYIALTAHSRKQFFYAECEVPDTLDGRFEVIVLHLFFVLRALEDKKQVQRALLEYFFADMDRNLREMGVGDMGVARRIKDMSKAAFGRLEVYNTLKTDEDWKTALLRNVYRGAHVPADAIVSLHNAMQNYSALVGEELKHSFKGVFL